MLQICFVVSKYSISVDTGNESHTSSPVVINKSMEWHLPDAVVVPLTITALVFIPVVLSVLIVTCIRDRKRSECVYDVIAVIIIFIFFNYCKKELNSLQRLSRTTAANLQI